MELAVYIYDALAYEQSPDELATELDSNLAHQLSGLINGDLSIQLSYRRWQICLLSAIAATSFTSFNLNLGLAQAATNLEPSVNTAPWCSNVYLCNTSYILEVQNLLQAQGFSVGEIDGVYGAQTKQAVFNFQASQKNLVIDGIPGEKTLALLRSLSKTQRNPSLPELPLSEPKQPQPSPITPTPSIPKNTTQSLGVNEEIGNLQVLLKQRGFYEGEVDGQLGTKTSQAILKAQQAYGLLLDGFAGPWTIRALLAGGSDQALNYSSIDFPPPDKEVETLQKILHERGFYNGKINGNYDALTRDSILKAQLAYNLPITGEIDILLIQRMRSQKRTRNDVQNVRNSPNSQDIRPSPRDTPRDIPRNMPANAQAFNSM